MTCRARRATARVRSSRRILPRDRPRRARCDLNGKRVFVAPSRTLRGVARRRGCSGVWRVRGRALGSCIEQARGRAVASRDACGSGCARVVGVHAHLASRVQSRDGTRVWRGGGRAAAPHAVMSLAGLATRGVASRSRCRSWRTHCRTARTRRFSARAARRSSRGARVRSRSRFSARFVEPAPRDRKPRHFTSARVAAARGREVRKAGGGFFGPLLA